MTSALCAQSDPDLWFQENTTPAQARALCRGCPLTEPCLQEALRSPVVGVWGATTTQERVGLRRRWGITLTAETGRRYNAALCRNGHDLTEPDAVYIIPHATRALPERRCVQCNRAARERRRG
jgi:WhiB family redox-sensing transcriptional regulator